MSEEVRAKALEPFFTTKPPGLGTGLGLTMLAGFFLQSAGYVSIDSALGSGCIVTLLLPLSSAPSQVTDAHRFLETKDHGAARILVVDDEPGIADLTGEWLQSAGYQSAAASSAAQALVLMAQTSFDLEISDVSMPGEMDGFALAKHLSEHWPMTPILLVSGYIKPVEPDETASTWQTLAKPYRKDMLLQRVDELLIQYESGRDRQRDR